MACTNWFISMLLYQVITECSKDFYITYQNIRLCISAYTRNDVVTWNGSPIKIAH